MHLAHAHRMSTDPNNVPSKGPADVVYPNPAPIAPPVVDQAAAAQPPIVQPPVQPVGMPPAVQPQPFGQPGQPTPTPAVETPHGIQPAAPAPLGVPTQADQPHSAEPFASAPAPAVTTRSKTPTQQR